VESWASLVDKSALEGLPDRERRRQEVCLRFGSIYKRKPVLMRIFGKAIFELIATEGAYVRDLQLVVEVRGHFI
jgi:actin cytoskeleton-regulatory complex protein PAN1